MLTIVVPFYNGHQYLDRLLGSIPAGIQVLIVDDQSDKPLTSARDARVIRNETKGYFTGAVNRGLAEVPAGDVLILNQDTYFTGNSWLNLINQKRGEYGLIGEGIAGNHPAWSHGYIHGTFMFIRRDVLDSVGPMDAEFYPLWGSTCEYQLRAARKGFKALVVPQGQVPGFVHTREQGKNGDSITKLLNDKPEQRGLFIRTPPLISVVINCYNHGQFLTDAINSLIGGPTCLGNMTGQTFQSFEVIIVDDGSTDSTPEICQRLVSPEKAIHFIRQNNCGSAAAMNTGIRRARGKYIAAMDADDMMEPGRLETMLRLLEQNPHSVIYDDVAYFSQKGPQWVRGWNDGTGWKLTMTLNKVYDFERILAKNDMHKGLLFPKRAWEEVGGYPEIMNKGREDWAFNVGLGAKGWCGIHTGRADYLYRRNWTSRTFTNTTPAHRATFLSQMMQLYPKLYNGERDAMCCGGGRRNNNSPKKPAGGGIAMVKRSLPGAKAGMVILEYIGKNAGDMTWYGSSTGQVYLLGGVTKRGYVDKGDAGSRPTLGSSGSGFLAMKEGGRWVFNEYVAPAPVAPKVVVDTTLPIELVEPDIMIASVTEETPAEISSALEAAIETGWPDTEPKRRGRTKKATK